MSGGEGSGAKSGNMGGALAGIRVVDLTTVVVGPTATLYLADYGADVIKVEAPGGDLLRTLGGKSHSGQLSGKFTHFNRNKRSLALDLKREEGREALHRLLATADVFIANVRPAALGRLGLDAESLRSRHPRLVVCNLMGFGSAGRYRDRPAYDTIIQGFAGVTDTNKRALGEPRFVPMVFADHIVGLIATQCIIAALFQRDRTGEGQAIEVPMFENVAAFVLAEHMGGRPELKRDPRFSSVKARLANVRAYFEVRAEGLRGRTTADWLDILERADVPAGRVHTLESILDDEHLDDVGFFRKVEHPVEGEMLDLAFPNKFSAGAREDFRPAPLMGGDSVEILREIGYRDAEIDALVRAQVTIDGRQAAPAATRGKAREA
jgi:crotonobetainyl-CoA:carnitine CoA-transferase CaiB-like acyl-CoA transferase